MSSQLYPEVIDAATLTPKLAASIFLPVAVEGWAATAGTAVAAVPYSVSRVDESAALFGATSTLHAIVKALLDRGAGPVVAIASVKGITAPVLADRLPLFQFQSEAEAATNPDHSPDQDS